MKALTNPSVEPPARLFTVSFVALGTILRPAIRRRVQVLYRMKALMDKHVDELTVLCAKEHGKVLDEAMGDVVKVTEVIEFACGIPHLMKGPALMNVTSGYDTTQYMEPMGVFAGIVPWNFPAMLPMGWMAPICIATGNTLVLKLASYVPQSAMRIMELWEEAGLPKGVLNVVTGSSNRTWAASAVRGLPSSGWTTKAIAPV